MDDNLHDALQVGKFVAQRFNEPLDDSESSPVAGPFGVGRVDLWQVWTFDGRYYHAHHVVTRDGRLVGLFRDFSAFAGWLAKQQSEYALTWRRVNIATAIVGVMLLLLIYLVTYERQAVNAAYLMSTLLGGGVSYLLGDWVRKKV